MHSPRSSARREQSSSATPPQQREPLPAPIPSSSSLKLVQPGVEVDILLKFIQIGATCCLDGHTFNLLHRHSLLPLPLLHLSVTYFLFVFKFLLLVLLTHLLLHTSQRGIIVICLPELPFVV